MSICSSCGRDRPCVHIGRGRPLCDTCRPVRTAPCARCGQQRSVVARWPIGAVCPSCYRDVRANPAACQRCGQTRALIGSAGPGLAICGPCSGHASGYLCRRCGGGEERYLDELCVRCVAIERLHADFRTPDGQVLPSLTPFITALAQAPRARSVLEWLRRDDSGAAVLRQLGAAGLEPTHAVLDTFPTTTVTPLRHMLVHVGALPSHHEHLERLPAWLDRRLRELPEHHRPVIDVYARWSLLHRARRRAERTHFTASSAANLRARIIVAIAFLRWLDQHDVQLPNTTQDHVDRWLLEGTSTRRVLNDFLAWASDRIVNARLDVPRQLATEPELSITEQERWNLLRRCLHGLTLPVDVRAAGALVLLYGLPVSRIVELTAEHLARRDDECFLRLGEHHTVLPPLLVALLAQLSHTASTTSITGRAVIATPWLFPGQLAGRPINAGRLATKRGISEA